MSKCGATTILSIGTTNAGHYAFVQQGLFRDTEDGYEKKIYDAAAKHAPIPPGDGWKLGGIEVRDYKSWHTKEFYKVHVEYSFHRDREKYIAEIEISPNATKEIYDFFREAVHNIKTTRQKDNKL